MLVSPTEARSMACCLNTDNICGGANTCMAWRWYGIRYDDRVDNSSRGVSMAASSVTDLPVGEDRVGYCGLAGKP